jgi:hypothetical protein
LICGLALVLVWTWRFLLAAALRQLLLKPLLHLLVLFALLLFRLTIIAAP